MIRTIARQAIKIVGHNQNDVNKLRNIKLDLNSYYCTAYGIDLKIDEVSLNRYIQHLEKEYEVLKWKGPTDRRLEELQPIITILQDRKSVIDNITNLEDLLQADDADLKKLAEDEKRTYEARIQAVDEELIAALLPTDEEDSCNSIVLEVNAGVGGQEAMLFANELFDMYCSYADFKGWNSQIAEQLSTDMGGIRHGSLLISGPSVFKCFKHEAGVHRVQRIPATEKSGRIHTSTVSVIALPQPSDIDIQLSSKDLKFETKRASGAGGQHVNTTDSAVRVVHLPTGMAVECQVDRSQIKNREIALTRLKANLFQMQLDKQQAESAATRKSQVRTNFRNEKIRTYNFSQDRITDHRLQSCNFHNLKVFFMGGEPLDSLIDLIHVQTQKDRLLEMVQEIDSKKV